MNHIPIPRDFIPIPYPIPMQFYNSYPISMGTMGIPIPIPIAHL